MHGIEDCHTLGTASYREPCSAVGQVRTAPARTVVVAADAWSSRSPIGSHDMCHG